MQEMFLGIDYDMRVVDEEIRKTILADDPFVTEVAGHLLQAGGKRMRPALSLLGAKFCRYSLEEVLPLAVALELIHVATLIHDDVIDDSLARRGAPTVNAKWGKRIATNVGDYILAKSLHLISTYEVKKPEIPQVFSDISSKMCEGEFRQIEDAFDTEQGARDYFYRVKRKTAYLLTASVYLGAVACDGAREVCLPLRRFGNNIGMAFQITDDILDMVADREELGKLTGEDLCQGVITLPVIYAMQCSPQKERLSELAGKFSKTDEEIQEAIEIVKECGAIDHAFTVVNKYLSKAKDELEALPDIPARNNLLWIADFIGIRKY